MDRELTLTAPHLPIRQVTFSCVHGGGRKSLAQETSATEKQRKNEKLQPNSRPHGLPNDTSRHKTSKQLGIFPKKAGFFVHSITRGHRGRMIDQIRLLCSPSRISRSYSSFTTSMMSCAAACFAIKCFQQDLMWNIVRSYSQAPFLQLKKANPKDGAMFLSPISLPKNHRPRWKPSNKNIQVAFANVGCDEQGDA